jgi:hypothetical protein
VLAKKKSVETGRRRWPVSTDPSKRRAAAQFRSSRPWRRGGGAAGAHENLPGRTPLALALTRKKDKVGGPRRRPAHLILGRAAQRRVFRLDIRDAKHLRREE